MSDIEISQIMTFGDVRRNIISDIAKVRSGELSVAQGTAIAALYKELHADVQGEINAVKASIALGEKGGEFARIVPMGKRLIGDAG